MAAVIYIPHEREHGTVLTVDEQRILLEAPAGTEYQTMFAVALRTGIRPYEYETESRHGNMIIAQNCKRKNAIRGKVEWKRIPVCPMLRPFLEGLDQIDIYSADTMRRKFHKILQLTRSRICAEHSIRRATTAKWIFAPKLHIDPITPILPPEKNRFGFAQKAGKPQKPHFLPKK